MSAAWLEVTWDRGAVCCWERVPEQQPRNGEGSGTWASLLQSNFRRATDSALCLDLRSDFEMSTWAGEHTPVPNPPIAQPNTNVFSPRPRLPRLAKLHHTHKAPPRLSKPSSAKSAHRPPRSLQVSARTPPQVSARTPPQLKRAPLWTASKPSRLVPSQNHPRERPACVRDQAMGEPHQW